MVLGIDSFIFVLLGWELLMYYHFILFEEEVLKLCNKRLIFAIFQTGLSMKWFELFN